MASVKLTIEVGSLSDLMGTLVGDVLSGSVVLPLAVLRSDGNWLLDGLLPIDEMKQILNVGAESRCVDH